MATDPNVRALLALVRRARRETRRAAGPLRLGLDGRSGSGKSTLATLLARRLEADGEQVAMVRLDDHHTGWSGLTAGAESLRPLLRALGAGMGGSARTWDWAADRPGPLRSIPGAGGPMPDVVLVEGCGATLLHEELDALAWLEAEDRDRRRRAEERDGDVSGWWDHWAGQETSALAAAPPRHLADLVLTADA